MMEQLQLELLCVEGVKVPSFLTSREHSLILHSRFCSTRHGVGSIEDVAVPGIAHMTLSLAQPPPAGAIMTGPCDEVGARELEDDRVGSKEIQTGHRDVGAGQLEERGNGEDVLEVELLVSSTTLDVSVGSAHICVTYYLQQANPPSFILDLKREGSTDVNAQITLRVWMTTVAALSSMSVPQVGAPSPAVGAEHRNRTRPVTKRVQPRPKAPHMTLLDAAENDMAAATVSECKAPEGFYFDPLDRELDWQWLRACDPSAIQSEGDAQTLLSFLQDLAWGDVRRIEEHEDGLEEAVLKPLQLAQLTLQYMAFCSHLMGKQARALEKRVCVRERKVDRLKADLKMRDAAVARLRSQIHDTNRLVRSYEDILRTVVPHFAGHQDVDEDGEHPSSVEYETSYNGPLPPSRSEESEGSSVMSAMERQAPVLPGPRSHRQYGKQEPIMPPEAVLTDAPMHSEDTASEESHINLLPL